MATIKQFEEALSAKGVQIKKIKQDARGVIRVKGRVIRKYTWDKDGRCYYKSERYPDLDIKL